MKKRSLVRFAAVTAAASLILSGSSTAVQAADSQRYEAGQMEDAAVQEGSAQEGSAQEGLQAGQEGQVSITVGQAAEYLVKAADDYNPSVTKEELLKGYEGTENQKVSRIQALVMISRAFGTLPEPKGNNARLSDPDAGYSDIPEDAKSDVENLLKGGVLTSTEDGKLNPEEEMGNTELEHIVRRIYALFGNSLKDDFYNTVNKENLDNKEIPSGETDAGGTYDLRKKVQDQVNEIIKGIVEGSGYEEGSMEQKIKSLYVSAVDYETRNKLGAEPLRKYLNAIDDAKDAKELSASQIMTSEEIASGGLFSFMSMTDFRDPQKSVPTVMSPIQSYLDKEELESKSGKNYDASVELWTTLLKLGGETQEEADRHVQEYLEFLKAYSEYLPAEEDYQDSKKMNKIVSPEELKQMMPSVDVETIIKGEDGKLPQEVNIMSPVEFEGFCRLLEGGEYLDGIKTALKLNLFTEHYLNLSDGFRQAFNKYNEETIGQAEDTSTPEEVASALVQNSLGDYIDRLYVEKYFSPEAKQDVEKMVKSFIEVYKQRIQKLDWMGGETKKNAIEKLDGMKFLIGYPDKWEDNLSNLKLTDSFFQNQVEITKLTQAKAEEERKDGQNNRGGKMQIPLTMVNAYYDQYSNTMCFPAAILQAPSYDVNASLEENLGGIGAVIAHEISHAFDNNGARYDKDGKEREWWSEEDYAKFQELCGEAEAFYDGWESAPGIEISGKKTLGENIADIGGVACALEVLKQSENPDYDKFFRAYAKSWEKCTTRARAEGLAEADEHSPSSLRVNRVLSNFQEFYDTYGISEGDGMYVPADERINIW